MPVGVPAEWSYRFVNKFIVFKYSDATRDAGAFAKHLRRAHVLPLDVQPEWDPDDPTPLATSPAGLSQLLRGTLFNRDRLVDLVEMSKDPLPGLEVTELPASAWPAGV